MQDARELITTRLNVLEKAIALKELELGLAELDAERRIDISDAAWIASIDDSFTGTILAVASARSAAPHSARASDLRDQLVRLRAQRDLLHEALRHILSPETM